jgi:hypothetical protein
MTGGVFDMALSPKALPFCSPEGIRTSDLFLERDEVERSGQQADSRTNATPTVGENERQTSVSCVVGVRRYAMVMTIFARPCPLIA